MKSPRMWYPAPSEDFRQRGFHLGGFAVQFGPQSRDDPRSPEPDFSIGILSVRAEVETMRELMSKWQSEFLVEGVLFLKSALDDKGINLAEKAFNWSLNNPGPAARAVLGGAPGSFYQDHANPESLPAYLPLLNHTGIVELVAEILQTSHLWLMYEQVWLKEGEAKRRTPWHQDMAYIPVEGDHLAVLWITLDDVTKEDSLEFIPSSHRGPLFNPTAFDPTDSTASMFSGENWPPLPNIEAARASWPICSWSVKPGDVLMFHPAVLHGGAPTAASRRRRSMSLRFFGDKAYCAERPDAGLSDVDRLTFEDGRLDPIKVLSRMPPGTPFRHSLFPQLR